jgi:hypothetical protein
VNRHLHPRQSPTQSDRSSEDLGLGHEGANYLQRSKRTVAEEVVAEDTTKTAWKGGGRPPSKANAVNWNERRASPRIRCSGSVEFRVDGAGVRMWGTLADISLHGCYVEMNNTYPVDTKVNLVLKSFGIRIEVAGVVRTSYSFLGTGICFAKIDPDEQRHLTQLIGALAGHRGLLPLHRTEAHTAVDEVLSADPQPFFVRSQNFFAPTNYSREKNPIRSRTEFADPGLQIPILQPEQCPTSLALS